MQWSSFLNGKQLGHSTVNGRGGRAVPGILYSYFPGTPSSFYSWHPLKRWRPLPWSSPLHTFSYSEITWMTFIYILSLIYQGFCCIRRPADTIHRGQLQIHRWAKLIWTLCASNNVFYIYFLNMIRERIPIILWVLFLVQHKISYNTFWVMFFFSKSVHILS